MPLAPSPRRYRHEACLYDGSDAFVDAVLPFLHDGAAAGEPTLVVVTQEKAGWLRTALGPAANGIEFEDMYELGANPGRIIPVWQDFVDRNEGAPIRGIGEPIAPDRAEAELCECQQHEALLNVAIDASVPLWLLCPYDLNALSPQVIDAAKRSHPELVHLGSRMASDSYVHPDAARVLGAPLPPVPSHAARLEFGAAMSMTVQHFLHPLAVAAGMPAARCRDLLLAAGDVAEKAVATADGRAELLAWSDDRSLICEFRDDGHVDDLLVGRRRPSTRDQDVRGLWRANQLCNLVQVRSGEAGTVVRLHVSRMPLEPARADDPARHLLTHLDGN